MAEFDFSTIAQYLQPSEEDRQRALKSSLMVAGLGMLANNQGHYGALGPALGAGGLMGMQNYSGALEQSQKARAASLQQGLALEKMKRDQAAQAAFGRMGQPAPGGSPGAPPAGQGPTLEQVQELMALDPKGLGAAAAELYKMHNPTPIISGGHAFKPNQLQHGQQLQQTLITPSGLGIGTTPNPAGGLPSVAPLPGSMEAARGFADVGERAKAALDMIQVPDGRGGTRMMTRESAAKMLGIQEPPPAPPAPAAPAPEAQPQPSGRLTVVAPDDKTAERWMRQYESQGIPATVKVAPKRKAGNPAPITEPIAAAPIRTPGGPVPTDALLGYTPPKEKEPPKGFEYQPDGSLKPIPGGPEDTSKKDAARVDSVRAKAKVVTDKVNEALGLTGKTSTGVVGAIMGNIPASKSFDLDRTIDTLKANLGFSELQAMREASPTGGALGQVAIQELAMLQSTIASLDKKQSEPQLRKNLEAVAKHFTNWKNAVEQSAGEVTEAPKPASRSRADILKAYGL